jgi:signal transduction histidine kinase
MAFLVALLTLSLVFTAVLAYQAQDAARSHRATAERALRDYASFAALEFAVNSKEALWNEMAWVLYRPPDPGVGRPAQYRLPASLDSAQHMTESCDEMAPDTALYFFHLDIPSGRIIASRHCASPAVRAWLADTIAASMRRYKSASELVPIVGMVGNGSNGKHVEGEPWLAAFVVKRDTCGRPLAAYGFATPFARYAAHSFADVFYHYPLLPPVLVGTLPNDSMLSVRVTDHSGNVLYQSAAQYEPTYMGKLDVDKYAGFTVTVALRPAMADRLVIGGLPRSRLPLLLVLVALSAGLVAAALFQLRREYDLARLRADFISSISHELRTPLAQVRMFAETLLLGRVRSDGEQRRSLEIIDQEARRLTHLVENVLQFSRAERRLSRIAPERTELAGQVREAIEGFAPIAQARRVRVRTALKEGLIANIDRGALRQTLINLLDNAVKYGPTGAEITITLERVGDYARIAIDDEGPGIAPGERTRIWEPFVRLERDARSAVAGSGIGLAVVRELIVLHDGHVWAESALSGGARFIVELPIIGDQETPSSLSTLAPVEAHEVT